MCIALEGNCRVYRCIAAVEIAGTLKYTRLLFTAHCCILQHTLCCSMHCSQLQHTLQHNATHEYTRLLFTMYEAAVYDDDDCFDSFKM